MVTFLFGAFIGAFVTLAIVAAMALYEMGRVLSL